jgi:hypothetical protein
MWRLIAWVTQYGGAKKMLQGTGAVLLGLALIVLSVGMIYVARVRDGVVRPFLRGANGQAAYATVIMVIFMFGGGLIVRALLS